MRTATPVNFTLDLNGRSGPRSSQVAHALIDAIARGQVHDGDRLPSTRTLAATFGLARTAVVAAYEELTAAGFLVARPGGSTYVERGAGAAARAGAFGVLTASSRAPAAPARPASPVTYDLRPGLADPGLISERDWTRAMRLAASPTLEAHLDLRDQLTGYLRRARGLAVDPEDIFLFPSVSNALRAVAVTCGLTGQPVAFEDPGYAKARLALREAGAVIRPVPVDDDGIMAQDLRGSDRACYVTPAHQFPLGGRMPVHRRADLLAWATASGALVLEDDYDGEFRYDVAPLNPLRSMPAAAGHVVYLGTSSKILARGLRVSWAVLPARFRAAMAGYLDASGEEVSQVSAAFLASFIATGALTRHQSRAMRTYRARQERFVAACREHIPAARALGIEAGLHVALVFDRPLDDEAAAARLADAGLACLPLSPFCAGPGPPVRAALRVLAAAGDHGPGRGRPDRPGHRRPDGDSADRPPRWLQDAAHRRRDRRVGRHVRRRPRVPVGADDRQDPGPQPGRGLARLGLARPRVADLDRPLALDDVHRQRGRGRELLLGVERYLGRAAGRQALGDLGQRVGRLVPAERVQLTVHDGGAVVGAGVEQRVRVDPAVDVHHAQRGRGARGHVPQRPRTHRAVHQDPVARPAVEHRHHPRPAVDHRAQRPDVMPGIEHRVQFRALVPGPFPVPVDLVPS